MRKAKPADSECYRMFAMRSDEDQIRRTIEQGRRLVQKAAEPQPHHRNQPSQFTRKAQPADSECASECASESGSGTFECLIPLWLKKSAFA
ncbi:MAG: hypothetical protein CVV64_19070 [Candidatus Wallbacteria bacterium HGW-Wallbacteria-1]|uniref:Uncharacterized protein n=1 Tax=Candidatus Wallbacteria bacterium HGW-Wallbacteria-1 TaxID=2013854 RepID=A0A2N1PJ92_9BACT|nr:MAG: hypothetical protein CVV64_19070 [Candidatus Wallbacteria bacterium HGW-Wallbacteria-1]